MGSYCVSEVERAGWIRRSTIRDAGCLTLVRTTDLGATAESFGAVTEHRRSLDIDEFCEEAYAYQEKHPVIALRSLGDWVLVIEDSGRQGVRPEVLRRAGRPEAVSLFWDEDLRARFTHTVGGTIATTFEPVFPEFREGADPDGLERLRADLPWSHADPVSLMLVLAGRITGVPSGGEWLTGELATYPVASWPDDLEPVSVDEVRGYPGELLSSLHAAAESEQRSLLRALARHVARVGDCLQLPIVQRMLAGARPACGELDQVMRELVWRGIGQAPVSNDRNRVRAMQVLRHVMQDDPRCALIGVLAEAPRVRGVRVQEIVALVRAELPR